MVKNFKFNNMEENKEIKKEKLSYEDLENVCHQLSEQSRALYQRLQDTNTIFKRLDYLFEVIKNEEAFKEAGKQEFLQACIEEVVATMTIPEENSKTEE